MNTLDEIRGDPEKDVHDFGLDASEEGGHIRSEMIVTRGEEISSMTTSENPSNVTESAPATSGTGTEKRKVGRPRKEGTAGEDAKNAKAKKDKVKLRNLWSFKRHMHMLRTITHLVANQDPYCDGKGDGWGCRKRFEDFIDEVLKVEQPKLCQNVLIDNFYNWFGPGGRIFDELLDEDNALSRERATLEEFKEIIDLARSIKEKRDRFDQEKRERAKSKKGKLLAATNKKARIECPMVAALVDVMREQALAFREDREKDRKVRLEKLIFEKEKHQAQGQFELQKGQAQIQTMEKAVSALMEWNVISRERNKQDFFVELLKLGRTAEEAKEIIKEFNASL